MVTVVWPFCIRIHAVFDKENAAVTQLVEDRAENNILRKLYSSTSRLTVFEDNSSHYDRPERSQSSL
jgi:hypothetical protein